VADINFEFTPVPSLARMFLVTPDTKMIFILGPVGSSKTTSCLHWLLMTAARQQPSPDGIRRTRFGIVRNTLVNLRQTIVKDILSLFHEMVQLRVSENTIWFRHADIESEWMLLGLDKPEDLRRLLSLQLSGVYINEIREIEFNTIFAAFSRAGRFPSNKHGKVPCTHRFLLADGNMGVEGSPLHEFLEKKKHPAVMYIHQPSALSEKADWLQYLPENYYEDQMIGATRAWIDSFIHSQWSADLSGEPIFAAIFNENFHVAKEPLNVIANLPVIVGIDPGLNPAAVFGQLSSRGQLRILREVFASNTLFGVFVDNYLIPQMQRPGFTTRSHFFIMDPAGVTRDANSGLSAKGLLEAKKLDVTLASTNDLDPRLKALELFLTETRGLETDTPYRTLSELQSEGPTPALIIDPSCTTLISALGGRYRYKRKKITQELEDKPEKKHPISDVVDACGYLAFGVTGSARYRRKAALPRGFAHRPKQQQVSPLAWT